MRKVIQRLYHKDVTPKRVDHAILDHGVVREKHSRENELQHNLCIHVKDDAYQVILLLSHQLLVRQFIVVVVLIAKNVVES